METPLPSRGLTFEEPEPPTLPPDFNNPRPTEVRRYEQLPFIHGPFKNPPPTHHRLLRIQDLYQAVQQVSDKHRPVGAGG